MDTGLKEKIKRLPDSPGVYLLKDDAGSVVYVGKAASLRKRVASYFQARAAVSPRTEALRTSVKDIDYIATGSEAEALIYEAHLIKLHDPKYNARLRDDKSYPLLKLTLQEKFPRLFITRIRKDDGASYFGPFTSVKLLRQALSLMRKVFPLRVCKVMPKSLCLAYHIGQCRGPCVGKIDEKGYKEIVHELELFLRGRRDELLKELAKKMEAASKKQDYEEAARIRDRVRGLTQVVTRPGRAAEELLEWTKDILNLPAVPLKIEAFDISNIFGDWAVGSMVQFYDGRPNRSGYRHFKIKDVGRIDDYKMIREVIRRRYTGDLKDKLPTPDLIVIDGGRGHLSCALRELESVGLGFVPTLAIAKEFERIYLPNRASSVRLPPTSMVLHLIQRIRDEAHRFAHLYHRGLRKRVATESELDAVPGVGPKIKKALIRHFGTVDNIRKASLEELLKVRSVNRRVAKEILRHFK